MPNESPVGESDLPTSTKYHRPKLRDLFALSNRIGCNKRDARLGPAKICHGLRKPRRHIVQRTGTSADCAKNRLHLHALAGGLKALPYKRRIPHNIAALRRREHIVPVHLQRIAMPDIR